jgi:D-alanine-D-alanine ligase
MFLMCAPLVMALARLLAYPGMRQMDPPGFGWLRHLGESLNQSFTLQWVPPVDQWSILYVLMLPTAALLITLARLTFGLRVMGFRSILIAVGFQEIGIVPSLLLLAVVVALIVSLRPLMRRIRLPLFARVSVVICVSALIMVGAMFVGPWLRSDTIWSVAFFPVIILAMLAEGIAATLERDSPLAAAWRSAWTVIVALLIAWVSGSPAIREIALQFPELMVTQLAAIVLIAEYLDFRLFENWRERLAAFTGGSPAVPAQQARVAVVRNRWNTGVIGRLGVPAPAVGRAQSVQHIVDTLRDTGFTVRIFECDTSLLRELNEFLPPDPRTGAPGGLVLNLATGIQGRGRFGHLPAMLEMSGVAYTGPDPTGHARMLDRFVLLSLLSHAGAPTPRFKLMHDEAAGVEGLQYPLAVRPRCEPDAPRIVVRNHRQLGAAIRKVVQRYAQEALVEEEIDSVEFRVSLLGNEAIECLPLLQLDSAGKGGICPAPIDDALAARIRECARIAYISSGSRDYARIDVRLTPSGEPRVVAVHALGILARRGSIARCAEAAGYSFQELLRRILEVAWTRYWGGARAPFARDNTGASPLPALVDETAAAR